MSDALSRILKKVEAWEERADRLSKMAKDQRRDNRIGIYVEVDLLRKYANEIRGILMRFGADGSEDQHE